MIAITTIGSPPITSTFYLKWWVMGSGEKGLKQDLPVDNFPKRLFI